MLDAGVNQNTSPSHPTVRAVLPIFNEGRIPADGHGPVELFAERSKRMRGESGNSAGNRKISTITANQARDPVTERKRKIQEGFDADLCVLDQGLEIQEVVARGRRCIEIAYW